MQQGPFLSFNEQYTTFSTHLQANGSSDTDIAEALKEPLRLKDTWVLWEQVVPAAEGGRRASYSDSMRQVVSFNTVQDFWSVWNGVPQPSELLDQKRIMRKTGNGSSVHIDALMLFKEGILPVWEHPANADGGHLQLQLRPLVGAAQIDEFWNNIVLGMIGCTIEPADMITGVRLVDKLAGGKMANGAIRLEVWLRKSAEASLKAFQQSLERCMSQRLDGRVVNKNLPRPEYRPHTTAKH